MLGELEENFRSLEQSSKDMVAHVRFRYLGVLIILTTTIPGQNASSKEYRKVLVQILIFHTT